MNGDSPTQIGRYSVVRFVGERGLTREFEVRDPERPDARLALHLFRPGAEGSSEFEQVSEELRLLAGVDDPHLLGIRDRDRDPDSGSIYYTVALPDGLPLAELDALPVDTAVRVLDDVLRGLAALHERGGVHRGVSSDNIFVEPDGRAVLGRPARDDPPADPERTLPAEHETLQLGIGWLGAGAGMSPEQARGAALGPESDVFSTGLCLYHALVGRHFYGGLQDVRPGDSQSVRVYLSGIEQTGGELPFDFPASIPEPLRAVVRRACFLRPEYRYPDAGAMRGALRAALEAPTPTPGQATFDPISFVGGQIGPYPVVRFVARGGMALVFEVEDPTFPSRHLALKLLSAEASAGQLDLRFETEAGLLARIEDPNVVTIYDYGEDPVSHRKYFTMTYVDGPALPDVGKLPPAQAGRIYLDVLGGLETIHANGIVHRDIKPANILLFSSGRAVVSDLGVASVESSEMTRAGTAIGTRLYMPPEQARGTVTPASDIFSVGLSLYKTITGSSVYDAIDDVSTDSGDSILFYLGKLDHQKGELPVVFPRGIPKRLQRVIRKACRFRPEERYQSAREMRLALEDALRERPSPWRRALTAAAGVAAVAAGAALLYPLVPQPSANVDAVRSLALQVEALVARAGRLKPAADPDLMQEAGRRIQVAGTHLDTGVRRADEPDSARVFLGEATRMYEETCTDLRSREVAPRAHETVDGARERHRALADQGAPTVIDSEAWQELETAIAAVGVSPGPLVAPCTALETEFARLDGGTQVLALLVPLERTLMGRFHNLVDVEQGMTSRARNQIASAGASPEFLRVLAAGDGAAAEAERHRSEGDYPAALEHYAKARSDFERAGAIANAEHARDTFDRFRADAEGKGIELPSPVGTRVASAATAWDEGRWRDAGEAWNESADLLDALFDLADNRAKAELAADRAERAKELALAAGAEIASPKGIEEARALTDVARRSFEEARFEDAAAEWKSAQERWAAGESEARRQIGRAETTRNRATSSALDCTAISAEAAEPCGRAGAALRYGDEALAERDGRGAASHFERSAGLYDEANRIHAARNQPPVLLSRTPSASTVAAGRRVTFSVRADDPNPDDTLRYVWTVDGQPAGSGRASFTYEGDEAQIQVTVGDGQGESVRTSWNVQPNTPPSIALSPAGERSELSVGDELEFRSRGQDPDGGELHFEFLVDGEQVASGERFVFVAESEGEHLLVARVVDAAGGANQVEHTIRIEPPPGEPVEELARAALDEYVTAYESLEIDRLTRIWHMNETSEKAIAQMFGDANKVDVEVQVREIEVDGETARVIYDQQIVLHLGRDTRTSPRLTMQASLVPEGDGRLVIGSISRAR